MTELLKQKCICSTNFAFSYRIIWFTSFKFSIIFIFGHRKTNTILQSNFCLTQIPRDLQPEAALHDITQLDCLQLFVTGNLVSKHVTHATHFYVKHCCNQAKEIGKDLFQSITTTNLLSRCETSDILTASPVFYLMSNH